MSPADVLHKAADGYRTGAIKWGQGWFLDPQTGCRCALGALAWAVDPNDLDGNPWFAFKPAARDATLALTDYLVDAHGQPLCRTNGEVDPVETIGGFNDQGDMTVERIIAALDAAAERVVVTA